MDKYIQIGLAKAAEHLSDHIRKANEEMENFHIIHKQYKDRQPMYRIKKLFKDYPFAHRQHNHDGHCKLIHGHNWDFEICLVASELDKNDFVYDFGKFDWLKDWFEEMFDHTCLINRDDPERMVFQMADRQGLMDLKVVDSCSSEGIAKLIYEKISEELQKDEDAQKRNVVLNFVVVHEDYKNSAQYVGG